MKCQLLKVGADAETFLWNPVIGSARAVVGLLGGTKQNPKPVPSLGVGFMVQEDNVMAEFNIPPATTAEEFVANVDKMWNYLGGFFKEKHQLILLPDAAVAFVEDELESEQAKVMGCEPDYGVWHRAVNSPPDIKKMNNWRCAGFHIHASYLFDGEVPTTSKHLTQIETLIKLQDVFVSCQLIAISPPTSQTETLRRGYYGNAGAFRLCSYGHEYRTVSGSVLQNPQLWPILFTGTQRAIDWFNTVPPKHQDQYLPDYKDLIYRAIHFGDVATAARIVSNFVDVQNRYA
jgi:hypothetical protein